MDHATEVALLQRCRDLVQAGRTQLTDSTARVEHRRYIDPQRHAAEMERIFRKRPLALAHTAQLAAAGRFITLDTPLGSLLITRGTDQKIRAFHNVCRHRGTRLVDQAQGCAERFRCPYHAWTYADDGRLVGVPHGDTAFPDLDRAAHGLARLTTTVHHGLVWVGGDGRAIDDGEAALAAELDALAMDSLHPFDSEEREWACNWKLIAEGGLEAYHFRHAHRASIAPYFYDNLALHDVYGPHLRMILPRRSLEALDPADTASWRLREHSHLTYALFPSATFLVQADHVVWIRALPSAVDRTAIRITTLVPRESDKPDGYWATNHQITCATLREDFAIGESIQSGLASGANAELLFGRNEGALGNFSKIVDDCLAQA